MASYMRASMPQLPQWSSFASRFDGYLTAIEKSQTDIACLLIRQLEKDSAAMLDKSFWDSVKLRSLGPRKQPAKESGDAGHIGWTMSVSKSEWTSGLHYRRAKACDYVVYPPLLTCPLRDNEARETITVADWFFYDLFGTYQLDQAVMPGRRQHGLPSLDDKVAEVNAKSCMKRPVELDDDGKRYAEGRLPFLLDAEYRSLYAIFVSLYIQHSVASVLAGSSEKASQLAAAIERVREAMRNGVRALILGGEYTFGWRVGSDGVQSPGASS
ncbi:unnamed protein product [Parajaminaea phylloscopi]